MTVRSRTQTNFTGGAWSASMRGRSDLQPYQTAVAAMQNMLPRLQGGVESRPGTTFVGEMLESDKLGRLIPFQYSTVQSYMLVLGVDENTRVLKDGGWVYAGHGDAGQGSANIRDSNFRWTQVGATSEYYLELAAGGDPSSFIYMKPGVVWENAVAMTESTAGSLGDSEWAWANDPSGTYKTIYVNLAPGKTDPDLEVSGYLRAGLPYEIASSGGVYTEAQLAEVNITQDADTLFLFHPNVQPQKIVRGSGGHTDWTQSAEDFTPDQAPPATVTSTLTKKPLSRTGTQNKTVVYWWAQAPGTPTNLFLHVGEQDPQIPKPKDVYYNRSSGPLTEVTGYTDYAGLSPGQWTWGNYDAVGWEALLVRVPASQPQWNINKLSPGYISATFQDKELCVTAVNETTGEESYKSDTVKTTEDETISISATTGALYYNIYIKEQGAWGWAARVYPDSAGGAASYKVKNVIPDIAKAPPEEKDRFSGSTTYPGVGVFYDQRLVLARSDTYPDTVWGSAIGHYDNFNQSDPLREDESFEYTLGARGVYEITWLAPFRDLVVGTAGGEWIMRGSTQEETITPTSVRAKSRSDWGSARQPAPLVIGDSLLFVQGGSDRIRTIVHSELEGYSGADLTIFSREFFYDREIKRWSYNRKPHNCIFVVMDDGSLLGLTYDRAQQVWGWHTHYTYLGSFRDTATINSASGVSTDTYFIVERGGKYYVERLTEKWKDSTVDLAHAMLSDCALEYEGSSTTTVDGAEHLLAVSGGVIVNADGKIYTGLSVGTAVEGKYGQVELPEAAERVVVGWPMISHFTTLPPVLEAEGFTSKDRDISVMDVTLDVLNTSHVEVQAGDADEDVERYSVEWPPDDYDDPAQLYSGRVRIDLDHQDTTDGRVSVFTGYAAPITVLQLTTRLELGDV